MVRNLKSLLAATALLALTTGGVGASAADAARSRDVACIASAMAVQAPTPHHRTASGGALVLEDLPGYGPALCRPGDVPVARAPGGTLAPPRKPSQSNPWLGLAESPPANTEGECEAGYPGCYWHAVALHEGTSFGTLFETRVGNPAISGFTEAHSLAQYWISRGEATYTLEEGWTVTRGYGAGPHLFLYFNADHYGESDACYIGETRCKVCTEAPGEVCAGPCPNGQTCSGPFHGFTGASYTPGQALEAGKLITFGAYYERSRWYIEVNGNTIGYIPESAYRENFRHGEYVKYGGEVYDARSDPTSQMGNGIAGKTGGSLGMQTVDNYIKEGWAETGPTVSLLPATDPYWYNSGQLNASKTEWHYGGPGA